MEFIKRLFEPESLKAYAIVFGTFGFIMWLISTTAQEKGKHFWKLMDWTLMAVVAPLLLLAMVGIIVLALLHIVNPWRLWTVFVKMVYNKRELEQYDRKD